MAVTSAGEVLVNAYQLGREDHLEAVVEAARATGLAMFVGVVIPERMRPAVMHDLDDATAAISGRLGPVLLKRGRRP
jgi:NAD/NADP transhydrogenase alpha subunit